MGYPPVGKSGDRAATRRAVCLLLKLTQEDFRVLALRSTAKVLFRQSFISWGAIASNHWRIQMWNAMEIKLRHEFGDGRENKKNISWNTRLNGMSALLILLVIKLMCLVWRLLGPSYSAASILPLKTRYNVEVFAWQIVWIHTRMGTPVITGRTTGNAPSIHCGCYRIASVHVIHAGCMVSQCLPLVVIFLPSGGHYLEWKDHTKAIFHA